MCVNSHYWNMKKSHAYYFVDAVMIICVYLA